jgi:hypothetical protein
MSPTEARITKVLLESTAVVVRFIAWEIKDGCKYIKDMGEFTIADCPGYMPLRIAKGTKLAAWARRWAADFVAALGHNRIDIEELTADYF